MIVLLTDVQRDALDLISRRIRKRFNDKIGEEGLSVDISFKPIAADKNPLLHNRNEECSPRWGSVLTELRRGFCN